MRLALLVLCLGLAACPKKAEAPPVESKNPYHNVTPQKVGAEVERIQKQNEDRNDKRLDEAK